MFGVFCILSTDPHEVFSTTTCGCNVVLIFNWLRKSEPPFFL